MRLTFRARLSVALPHSIRSLAAFSSGRCGARCYPAPQGDDLRSPLCRNLLGRAPVGQRPEGHLVPLALVSEVEDPESAPLVDRVSAVAPRFSFHPLILLPSSLGVAPYAFCNRSMLLFLVRLSVYAELVTLETRGRQEQGRSREPLVRRTGPDVRAMIGCPLQAGKCTRRNAPPPLY